MRPEIAKPLEATIECWRALDLGDTFDPGAAAAVVETGLSGLCVPVEVGGLGASMAEAILAQMAVEMARDGMSAGEIAARLEARVPDLRMFVVLETLEYLKKGGRISGAQAAIGTFLSVKPIIRVIGGVVETADRVRTRSKARERCIELICERPIERIAILHTISPDVDAFRDEVLRRAPGGIDPDHVQVGIVGASVGPHLGPGCLGAAVLYQPS